MRRPWLASLLGIAMLASPAFARAAEPPSAAQVAFDEGRRLEDSGDFPAAAARFEESERLEHALGTLLNLANCYERGGRLASAWRAFRRGADEVGSSRVDLQACKLEYSIVSPK